MQFRRICFLIFALGLPAFVTAQQAASAPADAAQSQTQTDGQAAVAAVTHRYTLNPLAHTPKDNAALSRQGQWTVSKNAPSECGQSTEHCVEARYQVLDVGVSCAWTVRLNAGGGEASILSENDDAARYFLHVVKAQEADTLLISEKKFVYPPIALAAHMQGDVVLSLVVGGDGRPSSISVVSGPPMLVGAATDGARTLQFKPLLVGATASPWYAQVVVHFSYPNHQVKAEFRSAK